MAIEPSTHVVSRNTVICYVLALTTTIGCAPRKKLIEFGWDIPDTSFMMRNIAAMEKTPFDGCVFTVNSFAPNGRRASFTWEIWDRRAFTQSELSAAEHELAHTRLRRFRHNFLRINTTPGRLDWFDDYGAVLSNLRHAGRLARIGRARGVLLDVEQYQGRLFDYGAQRDAGRRTWQEYSEQARRRGREVMQALESGYPGLTVFLTFGHSLPWLFSGKGAKPLSESQYGLLAPFLDGMIDAAGRDARIIDGFELSYGYREPERFDAARRLVRRGVLPIVGDRGRYRRKVTLAFGLWLDFESDRREWRFDRPAGNYFPPTLFQACVAKALRTSDEYVWIYTQKPRWWNGTPPSVAYDKALRRARR
jgi:hypothetical protein